MARASTKMSMEVEQVDGVVLVKMHFTNGEVREVSIGPDHSLYQRFAAHGVEQKFRDRIASSDSPEKAVKDVDELVAALEKGHWTVRGNGEPQEAAGLLVQALAKKYGKPVGEIGEVVKTLDRKQQAALRADPEIAAIIEGLRKPEPVKDASEVKAGVEALLGLSS